MPKRIIIATLGTKNNGMGHVIRCITLADALTKRGASVEFVTLANTPGWDRLLKTKYPVKGVTEVNDLITSAGHASACIVDIEHGPDRAMLERACELYPCVINIGGVGWAMKDPDALDNLVDLQIYQSVLRDAPAHPRRLVGVEYMIINPAFAKCMPDYETGPVVISMGGSDPYRLTGLAEIALVGLRRRTVKGSAFGYNFDSIASVAAPYNLVGVLMGASLSLIQLGMTAYESMAAGVPPLLVNISKDHERTSVELERLGCAINLGMWDEFNPADVRARVEWLLARPDELRRMGESGQALVDGQGAARVAEKVIEAVK